MKDLYKMCIVIYILACYIVNLVAMFFSKPIDILISNLIILAFILICPLIALLLDFFTGEKDIEKF